ncbi:MAG: Asp23/Gls24 family envelope stress response protein [Clostridiales bacterium]|jgi:uncharacterized alkaline shock family protein YloU|nr:Asp23/Gls24 family envelope stress response protein [Clostridiales bacterium]
MAKKRGNSNQSHDEGIIASIAGTAIGEVDGVSPLNDAGGGHFQVYFSDDKVFIDVNINADYNCNIPELAYNIQTKIKKSVESRTKYKVEKVNVNVISVIMPM